MLPKIKVRDVSKRYRLGERRGHESLREIIIAKVKSVAASIEFG
jgi:hypothetical protein